MGGFGRDWRAEQDCPQSKRRSGASANGEGVAEVQGECGGGGGDVGGGGGGGVGERCMVTQRAAVASRLTDARVTLLCGSGVACASRTEIPL